MPILERPVETHHQKLPAREALLAADTDVLVVGGGPAGLGAAVGAARAGGRVVLAEHFGFLGGNATVALVSPLASYFTSQMEPARAGVSTLYPTDARGGIQVICGVLHEFVERLVIAGGAIPPTVETGYVVPFDAEVFKYEAMRMLDDAGVDVLLHALASGVTGEHKRPRGVVFETKSGPLIIEAKTIVDCTGDADVSQYAGARYEVGRLEDGLTQPMTLMAELAGFDHPAFKAYVDANPGQWFGVYGLWKLIMQAVEEEGFEPPREDVLLFGTPHDSVVSLNSTRVTKVLGTDVWDLTYAEWTSRRQLAKMVDFLRRQVPGFEHIYVSATGHVCVRESRRVVGEYVLTADDILTARQFDDVIARNAYPMDIHNPRGRGTTLRRVPIGKAYDIPLRCLVPEHVDGLLVAGRCISSTHEALSSVRVMPSSMATGQAAGVCAALAANLGREPREVPPIDVQCELVRQGADLHGAEKRVAAGAAKR
jgi:hypothetical protein